MLLDGHNGVYSVEPRWSGDSGTVLFSWRSYLEDLVLPQVEEGRTRAAETTAVPA